jgi:hypothetical protein
VIFPCKSGRQMIFMLHVASVEGLLIVMVGVVFALIAVSVLVVALPHCSSYLHGLLFPSAAALATPAPASAPEISA